MNSSTLSRPAAPVLYPVEAVCQSHGLQVEFCPARRAGNAAAQFSLSQDFELADDKTAASCLRDFAARCLAAASELEAAAQAAA